MKPQGLAALATEGVLDQIKRQRDAEERAKLEEKAKAQVSSRVADTTPPGEITLAGLLAGGQRGRESLTEILAGLGAGARWHAFPRPLPPHKPFHFVVPPNEAALLSSFSFGRK